MEAVSLRHEISETLAVATVAAATRGGRLDVTIDPDIPQAFYGNQSRVRAALDHLVDIALRSGGIVTVVVSAQWLTTGSPMLRMRAMRDARLLAEKWVPLGGALAPAASTASPAPSSSVVMPSLAAARVLVADDDADVRFSIALSLRSIGAQVSEASDGEEAVRIAATGNQDVVLMDIRMPVLDGYGATQRLRAGGYRKPIIALTSYAGASDGTRARALDSGCDEHFSKPFELQLIAEAIVRLL